jgi:hypothetical protein
MPILKKYHYYVNQFPKVNRYVKEIIPIEDTVVSENLFKQFEDQTGKVKDGESSGGTE